ncbi:hypothetical protein F4780DRAFT_746466 [Xylariomycetidae sp. FL0641]|nr:hypothetical protein F4780DRAFT_746466 [Xylariomycetidae sp. FL0641]
MMGSHVNMAYFDEALLDRYEVATCENLERARNVTTIAIEWSALKTTSKLRETVMLLYSRLRETRTIILVVPRLYKKAASKYEHVRDDCNEVHPRTLREISNMQVVQFDGEYQSWTKIGTEIHALWRDPAFWAECNKVYAENQVVPVKGRPALPSILLRELGRGCDHERGLRAPKVSPALEKACYPGDDVIHALVCPEDKRDADWGFEENVFDF